MIIHGYKNGLLTMAKFSSTNQPKGRGRPKGSLNKGKKLLRSATPDILNKLIKCAKEGDIQAASTLLRYSIPSVRSESNRLSVNLPEGSTLTEKAELIADAALTGECCPTVASQLISALTNVSKIREVDEIIMRLEVLENG